MASERPTSTKPEKELREPPAKEKTSTSDEKLKRKHDLAISILKYRQLGSDTSH